MGLAAMNCNRRQNSKTINKQIGFLEASSVPNSPGRIRVHAARFLSFPLFFLPPQTLGCDAKLHILFIHSDLLWMFACR